MGCSAHFPHSGSCFYLFIYFFKSKSTSSMTSQHLQDVELQEKGEENDENHNGKLIRKTERINSTLFQEKNY